jgi:hypothetical protein
VTCTFRRGPNGIRTRATALKGLVDPDSAPPGRMSSSSVTCGFVSSWELPGYLRNVCQPRSFRGLYGGHVHNFYA